MALKNKEMKGGPVAWLCRLDDEEQILTFLTQIGPETTHIATE